MEICPRCKEVTTLYRTFIHGGNIYRFCNHCADIIEAIPHTGEDLMKESWVFKNIREAKKRRENGKGYW